MRTRIPAVLLLCGLLSLSACGGGDDDDNGDESFTTQILSDPDFDGDIEQVSATEFTVTQGMSGSVQSVLAGIDPVAGTEFRAFLDFPLTGAGGVPGDAIIDEAFLEIFILDLLPSDATLPIRVDLVSFQPPTLVETDFDRTLQPALASVIITPSIDRNDISTFVPIDVTPLMREAQRLGLDDFQVRIMQDLGPPVSAFMAIYDPTGPTRPDRAPLLTVTYF